MQPETPQQPQTPAPDSASTQPQPDTPPQSQVLDEASARQTPVVTMSMGEIALGSQGAGVDPAEEVEWQAQEYITTDKNPLWYAGLAIFVIAAVALDWFVLKTFFTVSLLAIVIAVVLVVMHVRPARMIHYKLDAEGLHVDGQLYPISDYKSFGVLHDGKENSVHLIPVKRFKPSLQVYFSGRVRRGYRRFTRCETSDGRTPSRLC